MRRSFCAPLFSLLTEDKTISKEALINEEIRAKEVRLIDADGNQVGIVSIQEAMEKAHEAELDLVNISPNAAPPVCRIMDYGKYRYDQQKREKEARKKQKTTEVKEMRLGIFTEEHDLDTKAKLVAKFLAGGDKVKISMRFRGREMGYVNKGKETMLDFCAMVKDYGNIEKQPVLEGRNMSMVIAPKSEKEKQKMAKAAKQAAEAKARAEAAEAADAPKESEE
jgi:translation initiation factor IF-3